MNKFLIIFFSLAILLPQKVLTANSQLQKLRGKPQAVWFTREGRTYKMVCAAKSRPLTQYACVRDPKYWIIKNDGKYCEGNQERYNDKFNGRYCDPLRPRYRGIPCCFSSVSDYFEKFYGWKSFF